MSHNKIDKKRLTIIIMLFFSIAVLLAVADRAPLHLEKQCSCVHFTTDVSDFIYGVTQSTAFGPYVYRVFIPYLASGLHYLMPFLTFIDIDFLLKIFFLIICQLIFYYYLQIFYSSFVSIVGVFILDILLGFTFSSILGPSIGENADLLNIVVYLISLIALYKNSFGYLLLILFIGTFNRETTWLLIPIIFLYDYFSKRSLYRTLLAGLAVAIPYFGLRLIIQTDSPVWFTFDGIIRNIPFLSFETTGKALVANAHTVFLLGPLIILSILNFNKHPEFLRLISYITPVFIVLHYLFGSIIEARLWIPLFIILIPLSLNTLSLIFDAQLHPSSNYLQAK